MFEPIFENVRQKSPLVHNITNYVTVNDCANMLLACGGSPIMADDPEDAVEITGICKGLAINIGTLNQRTIPVMLAAGKRANELRHPVVLDPVGAGASRLRTDTALGLLEKVRFSVIRGNISEIKTLALGSGTTKGVDADVADRVTEENLDGAVAFAKDFSRRAGAVIAITGAIDIVVVDSVAALVPRAEIEGEMGDSYVGLHARLMSQALRKLAGAINKTHCIVVFINQLREKVGVMYGNPEVTTGGRALKFYASVRIDVRRVETLKAGGELIGNRTKAKIVKNKMAPPFREAEFDIMYGEGISRLGELLDLAVKLDLVQKSGSWFSMGETRLGQGRDAAKQYLKDNPEVADNLEAAIRRDFFKLMSSQSQVAAKAAGRAVDVSAEDFDDEP